MVPLSSLQIYVKMMKTVPLDVKCTDTVDQIKSKIGALEGIDISQQALFLAGNHLEKDSRLADYNIMTNSCVDHPVRLIVSMAYKPADYNIMANSCVDLYVTDVMQTLSVSPLLGREDHKPQCEEIPECC